ncbi:hypothetical protein ACH47Z_32250 [Streptomyces sp. NPDC020192]|uniref:hypothetical protein n=1 Tax=Streptomyces sp. NPDC020192 TaxID=3365066 RepID=UPI0037B39DFB
MAAGPGLPERASGEPACADGALLLHEPTSHLDPASTARAPSPDALPAAAQK